jgi:aspartate/methionine/tyrosine aminotransferase
VGAGETVIGRKLARRAGLISSHLTRISAFDISQPPAHVRDAARAALDQGQTHYTVGPGILPLRQAIAGRSTIDGFPASVESVVVTNGGSEALYIALQSVLRAGDRIAIAGPAAPNVLEMIAFIGATPLSLVGDASSRFMPPAEEVASVDATALLLASPSPVTGMATPAPVLEQMLSAAIERGIAVILDRSLAWCCFEPQSANLPAPHIGARILTTGSFSDAYAMHGWRAGYFSAPAEHLATMRELKQAMSICTSTMSQFAALAALTGPEDWLNERRRAFMKERDRVVDTCEHLGIEVLPSDAWPPLLLNPRGAASPEHLQTVLGIPVEPADRYGDALRSYVRARPGARRQEWQEVS